MRIWWSSNGIWGSHLDSAFSLSISRSFNVNVSTGSPSGSPGIFNFKVVLSVKSSISDCQHSVVEIGSAVTSINTTLIKLEGEVIGLNSNRNWVKSNSSSQSKFTVNSNFSAVADCPNLICNIVFASGTNSFVRIFLFSSNSIIFNVEEW